MTVAEGSLLVAAVGLIISTVFSAVSSRRAGKKSIVDDAAMLTTVSVKLETIATGVAEIKSDMRNVRQEVAETRERLAGVEASAKQAHKRLDAMERMRGLSPRETE